jgi:hypothetical protein
MQTVTCVCDEQLEIDPPADLDLDKNPQAAEDILDGRFMVYRCPKCGVELKLEFPFRFRSRSRRLDCFFIPEKNRSDLLSGSLPFSLSGSPQCVVGYPELVERLTLRDCGLDERVIEVIKYHLLVRALDATESDSAVRIRFAARSGTDLVFHIQGLRDDEIGVSKIPEAMYKKAESHLDESLRDETLGSLLEPPYISINKIYGADKP